VHAGKWLLVPTSSMPEVKFPLYGLFLDYLTVLKRIYVVARRLQVQVLQRAIARMVVNE
jgi:hypothetical protein